jgi:hypothetical protein
MSSIHRSRNSPYRRYNWDLVDAGLSGKSPTQKKLEKGLNPKKQGAAKDKASLLDLLLDDKANRPASRAQPLNGRPRWSNDKDEFRLRDNETKGMPVRLSRAESAEQERRLRESRGEGWKASQWFTDGFDERDRDKRTT